MATAVLLDTNFLLIPAQFGVDIFAELDRICAFNYKAVVVEATISELEGIASDKSASAKDRKAALLGLQLIKAKGVKVVRPERKVFKSADKAILEFAVAGNKESHKSVIVATQDKELRESLRSKGVGVIILRQKQHLKFYL
ncbi:MAG TPA: PIN domain-containing protein [Candidatus Nanoarchaeia archaeon]|nr:PIN domain-containing protein [Candidatus Nanoarchaeia archaeon]